jgi:hypothetical protein
VLGAWRFQIRGVALKLRKLTRISKDKKLTHMRPKRTLRKVTLPHKKACGWIGQPVAVMEIARECCVIAAVWAVEVEGAASLDEVAGWLVALRGVGSFEVSEPLQWGV